MKDSLRLQELLRLLKFLFLSVMFRFSKTTPETSFGFLFGDLMMGTASLRHPCVSSAEEVANGIRTARVTYKNNMIPMYKILCTIMHKCMRE